VKVALHENLSIVEVTDPRLLDDLFADERLKHILVGRISEHVAVVAPGQFDAMLLRLRKLGHLPKVLE
jgi:hypothetical protein